MTSICSAASAESDLDRSVGTGKLNVAPPKKCAALCNPTVRACTVIKIHHVIYYGECKTFLNSRLHDPEKNKNKKNKNQRSGECE